MSELCNQGGGRLICSERASVSIPENQMSNTTSLKAAVGGLIWNCLDVDAVRAGQYGETKRLTIIVLHGAPISTIRQLQAHHKHHNGPAEKDDLSLFSENVRQKFEIHSFRNADVILAGSFPTLFLHIVDVLERFQITADMIRRPGGSKGEIAHYVDTLFPEPDWTEMRISADLLVRLEHAKKSGKIQRQYVREGFLDGHRIDFVSGKVALDFEWNSKDQTYDRDLSAFSAFYDAGAIDVGIILTRGSTEPPQAHCSMFIGLVAHLHV